MDDLEQEWMNFTEYNDSTVVNTTNESTVDNICSITPECSDIYISTKTKICYLNSSLDIFKIYWKIPILNYHIQIFITYNKKINMSIKAKNFHITTRILNLVSMTSPHQIK